MNEFDCNATDGFVALSIAKEIVRIRNDLQRTENDTQRWQLPEGRICARRLSGTRVGHCPMPAV